MKRRIDEWEEFAKKLKTKAEQRAEENRNPGEGVDVDCMGIAREIGAVSWGESVAKLNEAAFELTSGVCEEAEEMYCGAISGELLDSDLTREARKWSRSGSTEFYEKVPTQECWENSGRSLVGVKWVDANTGDEENLEHRRRLVAKDTKEG